MVLRSFGARAIREHLTRHIALAQQLAGWIDEHPDFHRVAPVPFSVVCFAWRPTNSTMTDVELDAANEEILARANATGSLFLSHTRVNRRIALRIAIGHLDTREEHVRRAWMLLQECAAAVHALRNSRGGIT